MQGQAASMIWKPVYEETDNNKVVGYDIFIS
jgi:hypothetical protein